MCGIAGIITKDKNKIIYYKKILNLMKSRGPNSQNFKVFTTNKLKTYMFVSRLNILDLHTRSNQPLNFQNLSLFYNGEVYNYVEIREVLKSLGYKFLTNSDTEVVLKAYHKWGDECVKKFEGMWSFAVFDKKKNIIFLSRDRFGEKPLVYFFDQKNFIFGSEINYVLGLIDKNKIKINYDKIKSYLVNGYKFLFKNENTFFKQIKFLKPGTNLTISLQNFSIIKKPFFDRKIYKDNSNNKININEQIEKTKYLLEKSVKKRLISDVPLAFCLSGGIDSGSIVSIAKKKFNKNVKCYSIIDKDERYNEEKKINLISKDNSVKLRKIFIDKNKNFISKLKKQINYRASPVATFAYFNHQEISSQASKDGYKVILSGTGADELFTGYYDHYLLHLYETKKNKKIYSENLKYWKKYIKPIIRNPILKNHNLYTQNKNYRSHINYRNKEFNNLLNKPTEEKFNEKNYSNSLLKNRMLNELFHESVPPILYEDDMNSMMNSIENRSPFLDTDLIKNSMNINSQYLIKKGFSKFILREATKEYLNDDVRLFRKKIGFNGNLNSVLSNSFDISAFLKENKLMSDLFNFNRLDKFLNQTKSLNSENKFIFNLINVKLFLDSYA
jgi:asparagine synthase (glutamine-hydrolysing)